MAMQKCALYRHFDAVGTLLYVGTSASPGRRMREHSKVSEWFMQVATITIEWLDGEAAARAAETWAINHEKPQHNKPRLGRRPRRSKEAGPCDDEGFGPLAAWFNPDQFPQEVQDRVRARGDLERAKRGVS